MSSFKDIFFLLIGHPKGAHMSDMAYFSFVESANAAVVKKHVYFTCSEKTVFHFTCCLRLESKP